jgi:radical SAM superfamily enzyme YgiQ (UPF0313 family)
MDPVERPLRIAFVNLRARTKDWHHVIMVPMGVMVLSSALKKAFGKRIDVRLFDTTTFPEQQDPDAVLRAWLADFRPDVVGIRGFSSQADEFPIVARLAKEVDPQCLVIAGGPHASTNSPSLFAIADVDWIVPNEGEEVLVEVIGNLLEGKPIDALSGLARRGALGPVFNTPRPQIQDLDALPFPDYDLIDLDAYQGRVTMTAFLPRARSTSLFTSRGCYYRCSYCHTNFGKKMRYRSPENVLAEMAWLIEERGVREFQIIDDIFNADKERALAIFDGIVRRNWDVSLAFPNGLRADRMDEEFVQAAKDAGTYYWALAVETASPRLQKQVYKFNKLDKVFDTIALSDRYGIFTCTFNMLGFPTETEMEMHATLEYNLRSAAHVTHFFVVTPYEGTTMNQELERWGIRSGELDDELLGFQNFSGSDEHGSLSPVPRSRIQELIVEGVQRFFFDARRLRRMLELSHNHVHLALHLETRRWSAGYDWDTIPDREAARLLARLFESARAADPVLCAHLPVAPLDLVRDLAA